MYGHVAGDRDIDRHPEMHAVYFGIDYSFEREHGHSGDRLSRFGEQQLKTFLFILLLTCKFAAAQFEIPSPEVFPDAPQPQAVKARTPFFAAWHQDMPKPLRTNRETFTSKTFISSQVLMWTAVWADYHYTANSPTIRPRPRGSALALDLLGAPLMATGIYFIADKYVWRPIGILTVSYVIAIDSHAAFTGRYH
jgi:hypothetical protein